MSTYRTGAAEDTTVDLLIIGSGTGMAAALAGKELGLSCLIVEKTPYVGGSTARSGGAFWIPDNPILRRSGATDSMADARRYLDAVVGDTAPAEVLQSFLDNGPATIDMLSRTTSMKFTWAEGYSDYHPEQAGGSVLGRTCECLPFNASVLGPHLEALRDGILQPPIPMPITGGDYRWINLLTSFPRKALPLVLKRMFQGIGGRLIGRRYVAAGQALAAGMYDGVLHAGIPVWTGTSLAQLVVDEDRVTGAVLSRGDDRVAVTARRGVVLAAGGFDHRMDWRRKFQSAALGQLSLGAEGNTGDAIRLAQEIGAGIALMDQAWWFPAIAPLPGAEPPMMLSERSLPGSLIVDQTGTRFVNEATDYMSFGQLVLDRERAGDPIEQMWLIFDQQYRNSYLMAGELYPRMALPKAWYDCGIACRSDSLDDLAEQVGLPVDAFTGTVARFNEMAEAGYDSDFQRGRSAYDWYYGDPTNRPNPNMRPLRRGPFYAVKAVLSDLGTCGGLRTDDRARVLREDGSVIDGLYATGNTAANTFGMSYPGAGATIGQGLVFGYVAAHDAADRRVTY